MTSEYEKGVIWMWNGSYGFGKFPWENVGEKTLERQKQKQNQNNTPNLEGFCSHIVPLDQFLKQMKQN